MSERLDALLVGFESQENLGLRYVMAFLQRHGYRVRLIAFDPSDTAAVVATAMASKPALIGFSIIFQYTIEDFKGVMRQLRQHGVDAHLTAGGHFPTLRPVETLAQLPELDSVVRFEGEETALDLLRHINTPDDWNRIPGLAFRQGGVIVRTPPRPLATTLDDLPWPARGPTQTVVRGIPVACMLASRGCCFDCAFCSIRQFYGGAPGALRRCRSPEDVVAEMKHLHDHRGVRLFVFHDDDFAAKTAQQRRWLDRFLDCLGRANLSRRIGWKISCRVDDIDGDNLARCREHGLISVYVGVESGNPAGLATLNKRVTVEQNAAALLTLHRSGIAYDMGFMLIDPDTTMTTLRENLRFLREVAALGAVPISFAKMMPLAGTAIEARLEEAGRLTGTSTRPDYDLLDPRIDQLALFLTLHFSFRNSSPRGLVERLRAASFDYVLARRFEDGDRIAAYGAALHDLIDQANASALDALEALLARVSLLPAVPDSVAGIWFELNAMMRAEHKAEAAINEGLKRVLHRYSPVLARAFADEDRNEPEDVYVYC
jgi:anaerobic magnesium-protoporphyrin IX monomethyl ester cyclase